jgi:hypothetical protein
VNAVDTISKGDGSRISQPRRVIVRDEDAWRALWAEHAGGDVMPPYVDFVNRMVAAVFAGDVPSAVSLARVEGEVQFADGSQPQTAGIPNLVSAVPGRRRHGRNPSSTGLEPSIAGALAYLAGPFSGVLLLGVERTSHFVRFHAWQSVMALGSLGVLAVLSLGFAFTTQKNWLGDNETFHRARCTLNVSVFSPHHPSRRRNSVMWATWWRPCHE